MCNCYAYIYRSCRWGHCKFESVDTCLSARLGLREKCRERIINGNPDVVRDFPFCDGICDVCHPQEAKAEQEELKKKEAEEAIAKKKADKEVAAKERDEENQEIQKRTRDDVSFAITNNCSSVSHLGM
ncbi:hypothetical protein RRF57_012270 [Xylaria bambusicola]|uniref:Uncharacterized protein n=1 Tax=Xylaria bambusicola TaxID=326684 RepID=A0AAN7UZB1_9PEZI